MSSISYFVPYIDSTGIHMPTYEDRLENLAEAYRSIFGLESELSEAVPDYQLLSVFAKALDDVSALVLQAYNSRNPNLAAGSALDLLLPQYGLVRSAGESDAEVRNKIRTAMASHGTAVPDALLAAVRAAFKVQMAKLFVNDTNATDSNGIPAHSIAVVVYKGNAAAIAQAIYDKKALGIQDYGSATGEAIDAEGVSHTMHFTRAADKLCYVYITIRKLAGADETAIEEAVRPAILDFINGLQINEDLIVPQLYGVTYAARPEISGTFAVADIQVAAAGASASTRDLVECEWDRKLSATAANGVNFTFTV